MTDAPDSARSLLAGALLFLNTNGIDVSFYRVGTTWLYFADNVTVSEGDLIAKAVAPGMLTPGSSQ